MIYVIFVNTFSSEVKKAGVGLMLLAVEICSVLFSVMYFAGKDNDKLARGLLRLFGPVEQGSGVPHCSRRERRQATSLAA